MRLSMRDHNRYLRACADSRATEAECNFLSMMASLAAAGEPVTKAQYLRAERLIGGALSVEGSIYDREGSKK